MSSYNEQMQFIDYLIRNRDSKHPEKYKDRLSLISSLKSKQQVYFNNFFMEAYYANKHLDHLKLGYPPLKSAKYLAGQLDLAPNRYNSTHRNYTRNRIVYGPVPYYLDGFGDKPIMIDTITACAINLMGTSQQDSKQFIFDGKLCAKMYQKVCEQCAYLIFQACSKNNVERLVMPAFGVGIYVKLLGFKDKLLAKKIMNTTFAAMSSEYDVPVDWVIWVHSRNAFTEKAQLDSQTLDHPNMQHVVGDMIDYSCTLKRKGINCAILNPGSDRTIGGAYYTKNPKTLEEQIAQKSDLLALQTVFNNEMIKRFERDLEKMYNSKHT